MGISGIPRTAQFGINTLWNLTREQLKDQKSTDFPLWKGDKTFPKSPLTPLGLQRGLPVSPPCPFEGVLGAFLLLAREFRENPRGEGGGGKGCGRKDGKVL